MWSNARSILSKDTSNAIFKVSDPGIPNTMEGGQLFIIAEQYNCEQFFPCAWAFDGIKWKFE